ncbi:hypothetical protein HDE_07807 [Halotydeus destructor]|nr:hypothetical protein HDE_07807 [Halotydeus destructor]
MKLCMFVLYLYLGTLTMVWSEDAPQFQSCNLTTGRNPCPLALGQVCDTEKGACRCANEEAYPWYISGQDTFYCREKNRKYGESCISQDQCTFDEDHKVTCLKEGNKMADEVGVCRCFRELVYNATEAKCVRPTRLTMNCLADNECQSEDVHSSCQLFGTDYDGLKLKKCKCVLGYVNKDGTCVPKASEQMTPHRDEGAKFSVDMQPLKDALVVMDVDLSRVKDALKLTKMATLAQLEPTAQDFAETTPVNRETAAAQETTPSNQDTSHASEDPTPKTNPSPATQETTPATQETTPGTQETTPATQASSSHPAAELIQLEESLKRGHTENEVHDSQNLLKRPLEAAAKTTPEPESVKTRHETIRPTADTTISKIVTESLPSTKPESRLSTTVTKETVPGPSAAMTEHPSSPKETSVLQSAFNFFFGDTSEETVPDKQDPASTSTTRVNRIQRATKLTTLAESTTPETETPGPRAALNRQKAIHTDATVPDTTKSTDKPVETTILNYGVQAASKAPSVQCPKGYGPSEDDPSVCAPLEHTGPSVHFAWLTLVPLVLLLIATSIFYNHRRRKFTSLLIGSATTHQGSSTNVSITSDENTSAILTGMHVSRSEIEMPPPYDEVFKEKSSSNNTI